MTHPQSDNKVSEAIPVTKELLIELCEDIKKGEGLPLVYLDEKGDYQYITRKLLEEIVSKD